MACWIIPHHRISEGIGISIKRPWVMLIRYDGIRRDEASDRAVQPPGVIKVQPDIAGALPGVSEGVRAGRRPLRVSQLAPGAVTVGAQWIEAATLRLSNQYINDGEVYQYTLQLFHLSMDRLV